MTNPNFKVSLHNLLKQSALAVALAHKRTEREADSLTDQYSGNLTRLAWRTRRAILDMHREAVGDPHRSGDFRYELFLSEPFQPDARRMIEGAVGDKCESMGISVVVGDFNLRQGPVDDAILLTIASKIKRASMFLSVMTPALETKSPPSFWLVTELALAIANGKPWAVVAHEGCVDFIRDTVGARQQFFCSEQEPFESSMATRVGHAVDYLEAILVEAGTQG